ncbi:hypothetical protein [Paeniroseomonas aquatica]|nr:hypothetical protein [Paeniroseomonas aquatica]
MHKRLNALQASLAEEMLCTDKTGTLTEATIRLGPGYWDQQHQAEPAQATGLDEVTVARLDRVR